VGIDRTFLDAWRARRVSVAGRLGEQGLREVVNAILYQNRTGCRWAYLPHDLPQKPVTSRPPRPAKTPARKSPGSKRGLAVDALGLIIAVVVTAASVTDNQVGIRLLDKVAEHTPPALSRLRRCRVQTGLRPARRGPGHRCRGRQTIRRPARVRAGQETVDRRAGQRHADVAPPPGPRIRGPARILGVTHFVGVDGEHGPPVDRNQHPDLARPVNGMHLDTILGLIIDREAAAAHRAGQLHAQISALTEELTLLDGELADLATTRSNLRTLTADEFTAEDPPCPVPLISRSSASYAPRPTGCAPRTSASPSTSNRCRNTSKAPARSSNAWSTGRSSPKANPESSPSPRTDLTSLTAL
jgi:transposase